MKKLLPLILCVLFVGGLTLPGHSQHCNRSAVTYGHQNYAVQQHHNAAYNYVPQVIQVPVNHGYYYSTNDYYRDKLLVDAVAGKVATLQAQQGSEAQKYRQLLELVLKMKTGEAGAVLPQTPQAKSQQAHPELTAYISSACLKCHSGTKASGGLSLESLDSMPIGERWKMYGLVNTGEMPRGSKAAPDSVMKHFYEFAKAGS